jgi:hypothetical protein
MNTRIDATHDLTLRSSPDASQSCRDASFNAEGETDRVVNGASPSQGSCANTTDGEWKWVIKGFEDEATPFTEMPAVRPSLCDARAPGSASLGDARAKDEESGLKPAAF